jgi:hypothetical protein
MKTSDFFKSVTSRTLQENIEKQFDINLDLSGYDRSELEDFRNKLRTRTHQAEHTSGINDLLTNETYQKDKAMLELLNTRIKEMLGEDIKKLRDRMVELEEAKKGVRDIKHSTKAKGSKPDFLDLDKDGDRAEPMKSAAKDAKMKEAIKKDRKELEGNAVTGGLADPSIPVGSKIPGTNVVKKKQIETESMKEDDDQDTPSNFNKNGNRYTRKSKTFTDEPHKETPSTARTKADTQAKKDDAAKSQDYDAGPRKVRKDGETHYYIGKKKCSKDDYDAAMLKIDKRASQAKRLAAMGEDTSGKTCNKSSKGKRCPVHGLKECGMGVYEGEDEGKPGKGFAKIVKKATPKYGKETAEKIAGAQREKMKKAGKLEEAHRIFKRHVKTVNESLAYLLSENEEEKAKAITAAGDIVNDYTSWMQRVGQYQTKSMIELADNIRADFGPAEAEAFKQSVGPALSATLEVLTAQREAISNAVATLAGEQMPSTPMGSEPEMDMSEPDIMNEPEANDEFAAADAAAGGAETSGREIRENVAQRRARKLAESHSIISKLAR